jgi:hypothetical protein
MEMKHTIIVDFLALLILFLGVPIHLRIFKILSKKNNEQAIDKLFMSNTILNLICQPIVLTYYFTSHLIFPMCDYIGTWGCLFSIHLMDVFVRFYGFCFPVSIALVRYLFVVQYSWVKFVGMKSVVNFVITLTVIVPMIMTLSVQFPISDFIHGPFNRCIGRFETFFNPMHPDPITPGIYFTILKKQCNRSFA